MKRLEPPTFKIIHGLPHKFEFVGYDNIHDSSYLEGEFKVLEWLNQYNGLGSFEFNDTDGRFGFEYEEDLQMMMLKFGSDITLVR